MEKQNKQNKTKQKESECIRKSGLCPKTQQPTLKQHCKGHKHMCANAYSISDPHFPSKKIGLHVT